MAGRTIAAIGLAIALTMTAAGMAHAYTELEGIWLARTATTGNESVPKVVGQRMSIKGNRFQIELNGELLYGGALKINPAATPPTIEFEQSETETLAGTWLGIYELNGDELTVCDNAPDMTAPRPASFSDCAAPKYILIRFTHQN